MTVLAPVVESRSVHRTLPSREVLESDASLLASLASSDVAEFEAMAVVRDQANWERFRDAALPGIRAADPDAIRRLESAYALPGLPPEQRRGAFLGPTPIVAGRQDHVVGFEDQVRLSRHYPRSTVAVLDRAGYNVHLEQPDVVAAQLEGWQIAAASAVSHPLDERDASSRGLAREPPHQGGERRPSLKPGSRFVGPRFEPCSLWCTSVESLRTPPRP